MAIDFSKPAGSMSLADRAALQCKTGPQMTKAQRNRYRSHTGKRGGRFVWNRSSTSGRRYKNYL